MLNAYHGEFNQEKASQLTPHSLEDLNTLIERLAAAKPVSGYGSGARGHHAWIIVSDHGFNLEIYFGESTKQNQTIDFVLYGPFLPSEETNIYDGRGLDGVMTIICLKKTLTILDQGNNPIEYVKQTALEVSVIAD
ncbi:MAG TPA: hypothetical protein VK171_15965 [Fimbriimonas sp.]|nr:hypothetical protein [Fimbriimonas sp.]